MSPLPREFFNQKTVHVAKELLGKYLVYKNMAGIISEVEAYTEYGDKSCHTYNGKTPRNETMYGPAGHSYIYFTYGMYHCLNFVTEKEGIGCAVLIRSIVPVSGIDQMQQNRITWHKEREKSVKEINPHDLTNGPGKLCISLGLSKKQNGIDLCSSKNFYIEDRGFKVNKSDIIITPRIGIKESTELMYRFIINKNNHPGL